jgi:hypothetical protein
MFLRNIVPTYKYTTCRSLEVKRRRVKFQVLTVASMKITAFWDVAPCSVVFLG